MIFFSFTSFLHFLSFISSSNISEKSKNLINLINALLNLLYVSGFLNLAYNYYCWLNNKINYFYFKVYTILIGLGFISYILISRYLLFLKINTEIVPWWVLILYTITNFFLIIRGFTSFSWSMIPIILSDYPVYGRLLVLPPDGIPPSSSTGNNTTNNYGGFMSRHTYNHYPPKPPFIPKTNFYRNCTFTLGAIGLCCSVFACYTYHKSANAAVEAVNAAEEAAVAAAKEAARQADASAVSAGVMSKKTYYERNPGDRPKS